MKKYIALLIISLYCDSVFATNIGETSHYFVADRLETQELNANLIIKNHNSPEIKVVLKGDKNLLNNIIFSNEEGILLIEQLHDYNLMDKRLLDIEIYKPSDMPAKIGLLGGNLNMPEDYESDLNFLIIGSANVNINKLSGDTEISVAGHANIKIKELYGSADVEANGRLDLDVNNGKLDYILIAVNGDNNLNIGAIIHDGEFSTIGNNIVNIRNLTGSVNKMEQVGTGSINLFAYK